MTIPSASNNLLGLLGLPGGAEWIIILVVILIFFGGAKIPELMRGIGKGVGELKSGLEEGKKGVEEKKDAEAK
jgi:sec-independent protein translocase protein TatA